MKRIIARIVLVLSIVCLTPSCATTSAADITSGLGNVAKDCALDVQPDILPAIETALAQGTKEAALQQLEKIAAVTAVCVVSKGVVFVTNELKSGHASRSRMASTKITNGDAWLNLHPVAVN